MPWLNRQRQKLQFYSPHADAVNLVIEGYPNAWPMKPTRHGYWVRRLHLPTRDLNGRKYHFEVVKANQSHVVTAPLACHTVREGDTMVGRLCDLSYSWQSHGFHAPKFHQVIIYETHLPALTRHKSAPISADSQPGTYAAAGSRGVLDYLDKLGVCIEFLPLHASDALLGGDWGYFSTSFKALRETYAQSTENANRELMMLIDNMHQHEIPVILDVVFNHGGELLVKAWGEDIVYRKHDNGDFCHGSGCGPTIQTEHPLIRETIIQSLLHLVNDYHIDGFRFDLGALHDKKTMLEIDRRLPKHTYLIAEPWALGGQQWYKGDLAREFKHTRWAVWNDDFREPGKTFILGKGDHHNRDRLMLAIKGCNVGDGGWTVRPQQCINYLSSHDGLTLADIAKGDKQRAFLGLLLVLTAQGVPMISEGSEMLFSKDGHDNSYDRPDLNQLNWKDAKTNRDMVEAVAGLIKLRKQYSHFHYQRRLREFSEHPHHWDINWIFPTGHPHNDNVNAIAFIIKPLKTLVNKHRKPLIVMLNGSDKGCNFHVPKGRWKVLVDGRELKVDLNGIEDVPPAQHHYHVHGGTGVVLAKV